MQTLIGGVKMTKTVEKIMVDFENMLTSEVLHYFKTKHKEGVYIWFEANKRFYDFCFQNNHIAVVVHNSKKTFLEGIIEPDDEYWDVVTNMLWNIIQEV